MDIKAILIGGLMPAVFLGIATCLMKLSLRHGISIPTYVVVVGATVLLVGTIAAIVTRDWQLTMQSGLAAASMAVIWSSASIAMAIGITKMDLPVAIIAPLSNSNAIVAVLLSALLFNEWESLNVTKVILGTGLIVTGASIISSANA